ncbi:MAG: FAD binding domain-containing protein [Spirochaetes bacterium]|nr:FAD binding domain-containing protein [Spirochaetota bacterium]
MAVTHNASAKDGISFPASLGEFFSTWEKYPGALIYAGGTAIAGVRANPVLDLPENIICLGRLKNLHHITRTERYLEIGSMVKLNQIIRLGKTVPAVFTRCLENIGTMQLRNLATIGGNICFDSKRRDTASVLTALDAQFELRTAGSSRWILASRFFSSPSVGQELLTRIRVPLESWDYSAYRKFSCQEEYTRAFVFTIKTEKNILSDIRVVWKSDVVLRDKNIEKILAGQKLPLNKKIAGDFLESWEKLLNGSAQGLPDKALDEQALSKREFANCLALNIRDLCE